MGLSTRHLENMIRDRMLSREDAIALIGDSMDVPSLRAALRAIQRAMTNKALRDSVSQRLTRVSGSEFEKRLKE